jgi:ferredoxin/TorA maturation chaperone TorD
MMLAEQLEIIRARAVIYQALAEAMARPVPGIGDQLLDAARTGVRVLGSAACHRAAQALAELGQPDLEVLDMSYTWLIASPGRRPVAMHESLHRQGCLIGSHTWDVERHYRSLGLAPADGELPDHASVELAFLGHLANDEAEARANGDSWLVDCLRAERRHFLRAHAGAWLPGVGGALAGATAEKSFYAIVGRLLGDFLAEELTEPKPSGPTEAAVPTLTDPERCTMCGLCAGDCPKGALRVIETAAQTALTLDISQCVGCGRCLRICAEAVLTLSRDGRKGSQAEAANGASYQVLGQSPRAVCPGCGQPTVSQAELHAVFTRLQADSAAQQRLSLCVECKSVSG